MIASASSRAAKAAGLPDITLHGLSANAIAGLILSQLSNIEEIFNIVEGAGVKSAAEVLNLLGSSIETSVLDDIRETDAELAQKIMDSMFTFDDLMRVDDRGIQALLKEVQSESLLVALKGATDEMREKVFRNMSSRAAEMLREDLASRGPVRVSEVEAEQKEILQIARRLSDEGQLMLGGGGDGQFL